MEAKGRLRKIIREAILEAADDTFSLDGLRGDIPFAQMVRYCREHLGSPIGSGSSRMVFQIDDNTVLKIAKNTKGVAQNRVEGEPWKRYYSIFPKIYETDDNCRWILCEFVLPAKVDDFRKCLGVTFGDVCAFAESMMSRWSTTFCENMPYEQCGELLDREDTGFFNDLEEWMASSGAEDRDIMMIRNWGLAVRDGKAMPVYLDHGLSMEVYNTYYRRR